MKTILITGCCGFIGSYLTDYFLKKSFNVIGVDNLLTGKISNIKQHNNNKNFLFMEHDICHPLKIKNKIDYILHFASTASPSDYLKYPIKTLKTGAIGTENILNIGLENNSIVLVASTSEVYGDPTVHPQNEEYYGNVNPIGPRSVYDEAKRYLEAISTAYKRKYKLKIRIARIFNTYGPRMRINDGRAIPNFINQALNNKDFTIYGDGNQTRSFCYIDDTLNGIVKLLNTDYQLPINIGNPTEHTIIDLVKILKKLIPSNSEIKYFAFPENDPKVRRPDITLAKKILQWEPTINIERGLIETINYFSNLK